MNTFTSEPVQIVYDATGAFTASVPMSLVARLTGTLFLGQDVGYTLNIEADRDGSLIDFAEFSNFSDKNIFSDIMPDHEKNTFFERICSYFHSKMYMSLDSFVDPTKSCLTLHQDEIYQHFAHYLIPLPCPLPGIQNTPQEIMDWHFFELANNIYSFTKNCPEQLQIIEALELARERIVALRN